MTTIIVRGTYTEHLRFVRIAGGLIVKQDPETDKLLHQVATLKPYSGLTDGIVEYELDEDMWKAIKPELLELLSEDNLLNGWDYWDTDGIVEYIMF